MSIRHLQRTEIDTDKWDARIASESNGLVYAKSAYLDLMTDDWEAIVLDDYRAVMPLPHRSRLGIRYVYQPSFVQQLGLIGPHSPAELDACLAKARERFRYGRLNMNHLNRFAGATLRRNYILDLNRPYEEIATHFRYTLRRKTKEDRTADMLYKASTSFAVTLEHYRDWLGHRFSEVQDLAYNNLLRFAEENPDNVLQREVWRMEEMLTSVMLLKDEKRYYAIAMVASEEGKRHEANRFLLTQLIREFAGRPMLLDFEGSDLPGVAMFYEDYGAIDQPYSVVSWNELPVPLRWLKK